MPIVFEQPDPVGQFPELAQAGGAVAAYNADRQYYLQQLGLASQQAHGNAQLAAQARAAASAGGQANAQRMTQAAIAGNAGNVSQHDLFAAQQQQGLQQQRFQQQQALLAQQAQQQQVEFTQADQIRLAQVQAAKASVQQQLDAGILMPEEAQEALSKIDGIQGPLTLRKQRAEAQAKEQHASDLMHAAAQQAALTNEDMAVRTQAVGRRLVNLPDPNTGAVSQFYLDHKGDLQPVPHAKPEKEKAEPADKGGMTDQQYVQAVMKVEGHVESLIKNGSLAEADRAARVREHMKVMEMPASLAELRAQRSGKGSPSALAPGGGQQQGPEPVPLSAFEAASDRARASGDLAGAKAVSTVLQLRAAYPDLNAMPAEKKAEFLRAVEQSRPYLQPGDTKKAVEQAKKEVPAGLQDNRRSVAVEPPAVKKVLNSVERSSMHQGGELPPGTGTRKPLRDWGWDDYLDFLSK